MWELVNRTPYAVERSWTIDKNGAHVWLVAVKATFSIQENGKLELADEQAPVVLAPEFWGDPAQSSVRYDNEVTPPKPSTDVLVEGSAYAPRRQRVSEVQVSLRTSEFEKSLLVYGPRVYFMNNLGGLGVSDAEFFESFPIRYEDAYGGSDLTDPDPGKQRFDARNPVGKGVTAQLMRLHHQPAHRIEYTSGSVTSRGPAGFGPLASFWSPRRERGGTYDDRWDKKKKPLLPDDYDEKCLLSAPDDQRPARPLAGGEHVQLVNMTPCGRLTLQLPKIYLTFSSTFGERNEEHRSRLGTVIIAPDDGKLMLVWNTSLVVRAPDVDYLDKTVIAEKPYLT
ncbi:MAG: DUF2169 domain-containing protein [Myxococcales bacterium]